MNIHRDNHARPGQPCPLNDIDANAAAANDHHCAACRNLGAVEHCPYPRRNGTTGQHCSIQRILLVYDHHGYIGNHRILTETGEQAELADIGAATVHTKCAIELRTYYRRRSLITEVCVSRETIAALSTAGYKTQNDVITSFAA